MGQNGHIFRYVMLIYAFAFVTALTLDTDQSISSWRPGAGVSAQTVPALPSNNTEAHIKDVLGVSPPPAP